MKRNKTPTIDISSSAEALGLPFSEEDWKATPTVVRHFIIEREKASIEDKKRKKGEPIVPQPVAALVKKPEHSSTTRAIASKTNRGTVEQRVCR